MKNQTAVKIDFLEMEIYRPRLFQFLSKFIGNFHDAEDLVQETILRALKNIDSCKDRNMLSPWLFRIAANIAKDYIRRKKRWLSLLQMKKSYALPVKTPYSDLVDKEIYEKTLTAIQDLPIEQREVFLMREQSGLSFKEIADILEIPLNTALGRMHYAVTKLRKKLEDAI